jgi:hypothetical protein
MLQNILRVGACALLVSGCLGASAHDAPRPTAQHEAQPVQGLRAAAAAINATMRTYLYDPSALNSDAYRRIEAQTANLAERALSREEFVSEFNTLWRNGPFSHVRLSVAQANAEDTAAYLDQLRVGQGATLAWNGDIAILTVNTMMGLDTIEQIDAAYDEIATRGATALIIDLRSNEGGAFAVRPLVGHVIAEGLDTGAFVSQPWAAQMRRAPTRADVGSVPAWDGWSLRAFWRDVQSAPITRLRFEAVAPHFAGPVYVLVSARTASAAELAADAFAASGRATLIGETTQGQMLSQKPFDLPNGLQLSLPIADYYAFHTGRIEGAGVTPHIQINADRAMDEALERARRPARQP